MKNSVLTVIAVAAFALVSCKKTEVTATDVNADSAATAVVVDNDSLPITSDSTINSVDQTMENAVDNTGDALRDGTNEVRDAANDATDGDGDVTR